MRFARGFDPHRFSRVVRFGSSRRLFSWSVRFFPDQYYTTVSGYSKISELPSRSAHTCVSESLHVVDFQVGFGCRFPGKIVACYWFVIISLAETREGFILGADPKPFPPPMKLCREMVEGLRVLKCKRYARLTTVGGDAVILSRATATEILRMVQKQHTVFK